jgi:glycosyltransferase involved in cell wall biosynthesis
VGGTNPSLLEAMASDCLICANDNPFNKYILEQDGLYFQTAADVASHIRQVNYQDPVNGQKILNNRNKIQHIYSWDKIIDQYAEHFSEIGKSIAKKNVNVKQL